MVKTYKIFIATMIVISSVLTSGCSCAKPATPVIVTPTEIAVKATETPIPVATETPVVTVEVKATETPAPTPTPVPTDTPAPTATATPEPTVHVHEWKSEVTEATCTAEGKIVYTCECGETYSEVIEKKEHAAGEPERVEPTVESEGKIIIKCSVCGEVLSEEIIAKLTPTPTNTPVPTATNTPVPTSTPTNTPKPTNTPSPTPTEITIVWNDYMERQFEIISEAQEGQSDALTREQYEQLEALGWIFDDAVLRQRVDALGIPNLLTRKEEIAELKANDLYLHKIDEYAKTHTYEEVKDYLVEHHAAKYSLLPAMLTKRGHELSKDDPVEWYRDIYWCLSCHCIEVDSDGYETKGGMNFLFDPNDMTYIGMRDM